MASLNRVCGLQIITALISMTVILWFLNTAVFPVVREAITQLPEAGRMAFGELESTEAAILPLAENSHLSIHLDLDNNHRPPTSHDLDVKLTRKGVYACTSFGCSFLPYGLTWRFPMDRTETLAWWDAWSAMLLAMAAFGTVVGLMVTWWALATLYCLLPRVLAFFGDRQLTMGGAWRLSAAALIPGAVTMLVGLALYGLGMFDWVHFLLITSVHFVVPWLYLIAAPFQLPRREKKAVEQAPVATGSQSPFGSAVPEGSNPFQGVSGSRGEQSVSPVAERVSQEIPSVGISPATAVPEALVEPVKPEVLAKGSDNPAQDGVVIEDSVPENSVERAGEVEGETSPITLPRSRGNPFAAPSAPGGKGGESDSPSRNRGKARKSNPFQAD